MVRPGPLSRAAAVCSAGMRSGEVINLESLRDAVGRQWARPSACRLEIERLAVSVSGGVQKSTFQKDEIDTADGHVSERDIARLLKKALEKEAAGTDGVAPPALAIYP